MEFAPILRFLLLLAPPLLCSVCALPYNFGQFSPYQFDPSALGYFNPASFYDSRPIYPTSVTPLELQVFYNVSGSLRRVQYGNELTPAEVKDRPIFFWYGDPNTLYTILMMDPDAPSRVSPTLSPLLHFLVVNIPGNDVNKGNFIADYLSPTPPPLTGFHRYMFFLYHQTQKIEVKEPTIPSDVILGRTNYPIRKFLDKNRLFGPIARNYFNCESIINVAKAQVGEEGGVTEAGTVETNTDVESITEEEPKKNFTS